MNSEPYAYADFAERKAALRETERADRRKGAVDRRGARDHAMLGPLDASRAGDSSSS